MESLLTSKEPFAELPLPPRQAHWRQGLLEREGQPRQHAHLSQLCAFLLFASRLSLAELATSKIQGFIHPKVVDVSPAKGGKGVVVTTRKPNAAPNQIQKAAIAHNLKSLGSSRKTNKSVGTIVGKYRPELKTVRTAFPD